MPVLRTGLIGQHIGRSRFAAALRILCDQIGWELEFNSIDTAGVPEFRFDDQIRRLRQDGWSGVSVTHPFKARARALAGEGMAADVAHLGACNTLIFKDRIAGTNTDFTGFLAALDSAGLPPLGDTVIMGAGGVAMALGPAVADRQAPSARIDIFDPEGSRARALATATGPKAHAPDSAEKSLRTGRAEGLINATPLGMAEYPGSAFDPRDFTPRNAWAFDAVYTPTETAFLTAARAAGLTCLTGFDLFRQMALRSFSALTAVDLPAHTILPELDRLKPA